MLLLRLRPGLHLPAHRYPPRPPARCERSVHTCAPPRRPCSPLVAGRGCAAPPQRHSVPQWYLCPGTAPTLRAPQEQTHGTAEGRAGTGLGWGAGWGGWMGPEAMIPLWAWLGMVLGDAVLQQSPVRAPWCCGAPWGPARSCVTPTATARGRGNAAPPAADTSAKHPPRVKPPVPWGGKTLPRPHPVPRHVPILSPAPLTPSLLPFRPPGALGAAPHPAPHPAPPGGEGLTPLGRAAPSPAPSACPQPGRGSAPPQPPVSEQASASRCACRTRTAPPATSAACGTAAGRASPCCRVRPAPNPARRHGAAPAAWHRAGAGLQRSSLGGLRGGSVLPLRWGQGRSSCTDHCVRPFQAQPSLGWGGRHRELPFWGRSQPVPSRLRDEPEVRGEAPRPAPAAPARPVPGAGAPAPLGSTETE